MTGWILTKKKNQISIRNKFLDFFTQIFSSGVLGYKTLYYFENCSYEAAIVYIIRSHLLWIIERWMILPMSEISIDIEVDQWAYHNVVALG